MTPHRRPPTPIGAPTAMRMRHGRKTSLAGPEASAWDVRAGRPVSDTSVCTFRPPSANPLPTGVGGAAPVLVHAPTIVAVPAESYRLITVTSAASTRPTSAVTAANTSSAGA